jgi:hypothetical protein
VTKKKNLKFQVGDRVRVISTPTFGPKSHPRETANKDLLNGVYYVQSSYQDGDYDLGTENTRKYDDGSYVGIVHQRHLEPASTMRLDKLPMSNHIHITPPKVDQEAINRALATVSHLRRIYFPPAPRLDDGVTLEPAAIEKPKRLTWSDVVEGDTVTATMTQRRVTRLCSVDEDVARTAVAERKGHKYGDNDLYWGDLNLTVHQKYDSWTITKIEKAPKVRTLAERRKPIKLAVRRLVPANGIWLDHRVWTNIAPAYVEESPDGTYWVQFSDGRGRAKLQQGRDVVLIDGSRPVVFSEAEKLTHEPS